jgi:hypothetical protein
MSQFRKGNLVRFRTTSETIANDVDGKPGVVLYVGDDGRPQVSVDGYVFSAHDDELELEE